MGHDVASHAHCPVVVLHSCPVAHTLHATPPAPQDPFVSPERGSQVVPLQQPVHDVPPQVHAPVEHDSPDPHAEHAAPPVPHADGPWAAYCTHTLPLQQPLGHDVASHTHCPVPLHSWPVWHAAHVAPPVPQEPVDSPV